MKTNKNDWNLVPVSRVTRIFLGGTPKRAEPKYWGNGIKWASAADVAACETRYIRQTTEQITELGLRNSAAKLLGKETIVITARGTVGALCMLPEPMSFNQTCYGLVCNEFVDSTFFYFALKARVAHIRSQTYGAIFETITMQSFDNIRVPLPPLPTQRKIAAILSAYDDLIENNTRRIKILEEMAQLIYREWFVNFRFPGHEKVEMVESELGPIPEGWEVKRFTEAINVNPATKVQKEGSKPYVAMDGLSNNSMLATVSEWREGNGGSKFKNRDTLFARITPCLENGKTGYVQFLPSDEDVAIGSTEFIVLRSKTLCPEYVYLLARTEKFRGNAIKSMTGASGRQRVQLACFGKFLFAHPDKTTIQRFRDIVSPLFMAIQVLSEKNENLRHTRDLLLPKLVSGEVDVSDLDINVESTGVE